MKCAFLKTKSVRVLVFALGMLIYVWYWVPIFPMEPVFNILVEHEQKLVSVSSYEFSVNDVKSIVKTLASYGEQFYVHGSKVLITPQLFFNKEILWNYTAKSEIVYPDDDYDHDKQYNIWIHK